MKLFHSMTTVKIVHSLVWFIMATATVYIFYCGVFGIINVFLYISLLLLAFEIVALLLNNWSCPLTIVAKNISPDWKNGDDIFLPVWFANYNKTIFGGLLIIGVVLVILQALGII